MGMGPNWVQPTAISQEVPYLQNFAPERLCLATYLNASVNCGLIVTIFYLLILKFGNTHLVSSSIVVPSIIIISCLCCFAAAAVNGLILAGISLPLYIVAFIGGGVGSLSSVVMNPFLMQFENNFITASRSGGSGAILLTAVVAIIQSPGRNERFDSGVYLTVFGCLLSLPIFAYRYIVKYKLGVREERAVPSPIESDEDNKYYITSIEKTQENPINTSLATTSSSSSIATLTSSVNDNANLVFWNTTWFKTLLPYLFIVAWVNLNTWGLIGKLIYIHTPFPCL